MEKVDENSYSLFETLCRYSAGKNNCVLPLARISLNTKFVADVRFR